MDCHPYAQLFPLLDEAGLKALADDIRKHGLREPITTDPEGRIIDGRNRLAACKLAGVTPVYDPPFVGDDRGVLSLVISKNLHRRHLNESQRAMVAADIANLPRGRQPADNGKPANRRICESPPVSQSQAADLLNVSERSVSRAKRIQRDASPDVQAAVRGGAKRLSTIERERPRRPKRKAAVSRFNDEAFLPLCAQLQDWIAQRFDRAGGAEARDECAKLLGQFQRRIEQWRKIKPL